MDLRRSAWLVAAVAVVSGTVQAEAQPAASDVARPAAEGAARPPESARPAGRASATPPASSAVPPRRSFRDRSLRSVPGLSSFQRPGVGLTQPLGPQRLAAGSPASSQLITERAKALQQSRARARQQRQELGSRLGADRDQPGVRAELREHALRMARLKRITQLAQELDRKELVARAGSLMSRETERHSKRMSELIAAPRPLGSVAASAHPDDPKPPAPAPLAPSAKPAKGTPASSLSPARPSTVPPATSTHD